MLKYSFLIIVLAYFCFAGSALAYQLPRWEIGLAMGYLNSPEYRGAKVSRHYYIPFPYIAYRGDYFRVDEEGIRGQLVERKNWKLDFRVAGNVPVTSDELSKRSDMPALDPVGEIGPSVEFKLAEFKPIVEELWLRLPIRAMVSIGSPILEYQGWSFAPYLEYVRKYDLPDRIWNVGLAVGPLYASSGYHNYFYQVSSDDVTPNRPLYNSSTGYSGSRITLTVTSSGKHIWLGGFARYDFLRAAVFTDSPLVEIEQYLTVGVSIGWLFYRS